MFSALKGNRLIFPGHLYGDKGSLLYDSVSFHSHSQAQYLFFVSLWMCKQTKCVITGVKEHVLFLKNVHFNLVQFVKHFSHFYFINEGVLRKYCNSFKRQEYIYWLNDGTGSLNTTLTAEKRKCNYSRCQSCSHRTSLTLK